MEKSKKNPILVYWCVFLYFVILFTERMISIILSFMDADFSIFESMFSTYAYCMVIASLCAFLILLFTCNMPFLSALFSWNRVDTLMVDSRGYSILVGVLLISGMIHTNYSNFFVQCISYGFLIVGLVLATIANLRHDKTDVYRWISLIYLVAYSMAIPVVYESHLPNAFIINIVLAASSLILIGLFTFMSCKVFSGKADSILYVEPIHIAMFLNAILIWLRWDEGINLFLLISLVIAVVIWVVGKYIRIK